MKRNQILNEQNIFPASTWTYHSAFYSNFGLGLVIGGASQCLQSHGGQGGGQELPRPTQLNAEGGGEGGPRLPENQGPRGSATSWNPACRLDLL